MGGGETQFGICISISIAIITSIISVIIAISIIISIIISDMIAITITDITVIVTITNTTITNTITNTTIVIVLRQQRDLVVLGHPVHPEHLRNPLQESQQPPPPLPHRCQHVGAHPRPQSVGQLHRFQGVFCGIDEDAPTGPHHQFIRGLRPGDTKRGGVVCTTSIGDR